MNTPSHAKVQPFRCALRAPGGEPRGMYMSERDKPESAIPHAEQRLPFETFTDTAQYRASAPFAKERHLGHSNNYASVGFGFFFCK